MFSSNDHGAASTPGAPQPSGWIWRGNYLPGCWGALPGALGKALGVLGGPVYVEMTLLIAQKPLFGAGQKSHPVPCVCSCLSALLRAQMWSPQAQGGVRPGFQAGWGAKGLGSPCRRPGDRLQASWLLPRPSRRPASPPPPLPLPTSRTSVLMGERGSQPQLPHRTALPRCSGPLGPSLLLQEPEPRHLSWEFTPPPPSPPLSFLAPRQSFSRASLDLWAF